MQAHSVGVAAHQQADAAQLPVIDPAASPPHCARLAAAARPGASAAPDRHVQLASLQATLSIGCVYEGSKLGCCLTWPSVEVAEVQRFELQAWGADCQQLEPGLSGLPPAPQTGSALKSGAQVHLQPALAPACLHEHASSQQACADAAGVCKSQQQAPGAERSIEE